MRLFLNSGITEGYRRHFTRKFGRITSFRERRGAFIGDRFGASHFLKPVLDGDESAFFTNGDDEILQRAWAEEQGMKWTGNLSETLLAQIEEHGTEVFYNLDPIRFGSDFVRRLPGCVKYTICWRAAPSHGVDLGGYNLVVCNFPSIIAAWRAKGWKAEYFFPAHDPIMDEYVRANDSPIDVVFVGGYSRHHKKRAEVLEAIAGMSARFEIHLHLECSRVTRWAERPLARLFPLSHYRRPGIIQTVSRSPVFGRDLYELLRSSKIVLNGAIDMAGEDRGNMRCFEAMGCGALLLSDAGLYPTGMVPGDNMLAYSSPQEAVASVERALGDWNHYSEMAKRGRAMIRSLYNKERQWEEFIRLVDQI